MGKPQYVSPTINIVDAGEELSEAHGNLGLPFGLCAKYGIPIGEGWTPRDAWDALENKFGKKPKDFYDELEDTEQVEVGEEVVEEKVDEEAVKVQRERVKSAFLNNPAVKNIPENTRNKIMDSFEKLDSNALEFMENHINNVVKFKQDSCGYMTQGKQHSIYFNMKEGSRNLDKELGFDFSASAFYHELGHCIDNDIGIDEKGSIMAFDSDKTETNQDAKDALNKIIALGGGAPIENMDKFPIGTARAFANGINSMIDNMAGEKIEYKSPRDFNYVPEPVKPDSFEKIVADKKLRQGTQRYSQEKWFAQWAMEEYEEKMKAYEVARQDKDYEKKKAEYEEYNAKYKARAEARDAMADRLGILTDFFGIYTRNRLDVRQMGFYGHSAKYNKDWRVNAQCETWAEYFSAKCTNDTKTLDIFKEYMPNIHNQFEDMYKRSNK